MNSCKCYAFEKARAPLVIRLNGRTKVYRERTLDGPFTYMSGTFSLILQCTNCGQSSDVGGPKER